MDFNMHITDVQPRRKSLMAVYIDGEPVLIDRETFLLSKFKAGCVITQGELDELKQKSENHRAHEKALWLLSQRDHSKEELISKLKRTSGEEAAHNAVEKMERVGLIDDKEFARKYTADLINFKHLAPKSIRYELLKKGIDRDVIDEIIQEIDCDEEKQLASLIEQRFAHSLDNEKAVKRAFAYLIRKGYSYSQIKAAIKLYTEEDFDAL